MSPKLWVFLIIPVLVVPIDQLTKSWVTGSIELGGSVPVIDGFFAITHVLNRGIVFGMFQGGYVWLFLLLTALAVLLIWTFFRQLPRDEILASSALGLILGGAIGNGIDRIARQAVVDFLHFDFGWFVYPDFNFADSCIVVGVALLLLAPHAWSSEEPDSAAQRASDSGTRRTSTASEEPG